MDKAVIDQAKAAYSWMPVVILSGDFTVKAGFQLGPRRMDMYELVYFPYGSQTEYQDKTGNYTLEQSCLTLTRPDEEHRFQFDPNIPVRHLFIAFSVADEKTKVWFDPLLGMYSHFIIEPDNPVPAWIKHILHLSDTQPARWKSRCNVLLFAVLEELWGRSEQNTRRAGSKPNTSYQIQLSIDIMHQHLFKPLPMNTLAERIGWSHGYFARAFRRELGVTPIQYLNRMRIDKSCELLLQENISVKEMAHLLGFNNEHYFSFLFKQIKGFSATLYREKYADPRFRFLSAVTERNAAYAQNTYFYNQNGD